MRHAPGARDANRARVPDGTVVAVHGVIVDVDYPRGPLPSIGHAVVVERPGRAPLTMEVHAYASPVTARCISLESPEGMRRGLGVRDTGAPVMLPAGEATLGRVFNVLGRPIDGGPVPQGGERRSIFVVAAAPGGSGGSDDTLRHRDQGAGPAGAAAAGREGRPVRRRRRGEDGPDHRAHAADRATAPRCGDLRRDRGADPGSQRAVSPDAGRRRARAIGARVRSDERVGGGAVPGGIQRAVDGRALP